MDLTTFTTKIIDDGIAAARESYDRPDEQDKLGGAVAGFEACRGLDPTGLATLLEEAMKDCDLGRLGEALPRRYWYYRCFALEVEWVCNCVSAILSNEGLPTIVIPTARGFLKAAEVVGVKDAT